MNVCMHVCKSIGACMCVSMYACVIDVPCGADGTVCMYECMHACMYVCKSIEVCMFVSIYACVNNVPCGGDGMICMYV